MPGPRVAVIIPNWNGAHLLRPCLASLLAQTYDGFEVIVVDNASHDESLALIEREFPTVRTLALSTNGGYSGGCNAGIQHSQAEIVVMLNNDTEAEPDWLAHLIAGLDRHPEAGMATSRIMLYDRRDVLNAAGDLYRRDGTPDSRGVWQPYGPPYDREELVFGGSGGALALRRAMLDEIGLFETAFFMYCEDVDLSWRAQLAGYRCVYVPDAVIYHRLSATGGGALSSFYVGRNTLWTLARNYPPPLLRRSWPAIIRAQLGIAWRALRAIRGAAARARLRGQLAGVATMHRWRAERRARWRRARVGVDYIQAILD